MTRRELRSELDLLKGKVQNLSERHDNLENEVRTPYKFKMMDKVESISEYRDAFSGVVVHIYRSYGTAKYGVFNQQSNLVSEFENEELKLKK